MAPSGLLTDLYELNMAASYLQRGMGGEATFSLFVRQLPPTRGFLVAAGLEPCLEFLEGFGLSEPELDYLGRELGFEDPVLDALGALRFSGEVWAVPEGRVVYANEPLLEITAPIAVAQLVEPYLLNQITFQTTIASKAARCVLAADGRDVVDFALRRTQGLDAALAVARCSAIVGFAATSNVEAARRYGLRPTGTMAHSYIESFASEKDAFRTFARDFPDRTTFLVDTYDTMNGVRTAIEVIRELGLTGDLAVRLDSGDLAELSRGARALLDEVGLQRVRIFASGGLDEYQLDRLVRGGAPIDAFGVGTRMGVSADAPSLDSAYKLVEYDRGAKGDVIGLRDEPLPEGHEPLLIPVMTGGRRTGPQRTIEIARTLFRTDLERVAADAARIEEPVASTPRTSEALGRLADDAKADALKRAGLP